MINIANQTQKRRQIERKIDGIIVLHAERALRNFDESFIISLARSSGVDFVQCLTDRAHTVAKNLEKLCGLLCVDNVELFPRFHELVKKDFERSSPKLDNIEIEITDSMKELQRILLDLLSKSITEVRKSGVDMGKYSVESLITWHGLQRWIDKDVQPVWDILSGSCKQAVNDIKELKQLLYALNYTNAVYFHFLLEARKKEHIEKHELGWMEWESSSSLFSLAKSRVYGPKGELEIEIPPKWEAFTTMFNQLQKTRTNKSVLITCKTFKSAQLIFSLLKKSPAEVILNEYKRLVLNAEVLETNDFNESQPLAKVGDVYVLVLQSAQYGLDTILSDIEPEMIIVYDINLEAIRQIENYKARRPAKPCHAVVLTYAQSVEEQQYLTVLNREIKSFETLVAEKDELIKRPDLKTGVPDSEKVLVGKFHSV